MIRKAELKLFIYQSKRLLHVTFCGLCVKRGHITELKPEKRQFQDINLAEFWLKLKDVDRSFCTGDQNCWKLNSQITECTLYTTDSAAGLNHFNAYRV